MSGRRGRRVREERSERLVVNLDRLRRQTHTAGPGPYERSERRMRIALLAPANSPHTRRWTDFYASRGIEVYAISLETQPDAGPPRPRVRTAYLPVLRGNSGRGVASPRTVKRVRALLDQARPDVVHVHLVGGYGVLGALADRHPCVLTVGVDGSADLGEDGPGQRRKLEFVLRRVDAVCATSRLAAAALSRFSDRPVTLTPLGVDTERYLPAPRAPDGRFVVGIVTSPRDGLRRDTVERAHRELTDRPGAAPTDLVVLGSADAGLPGALARLDALVVGTDRDGLGLVAVAGQSCAVPVVVAGVGTLAEVVRDGETGYVVPANDPAALAERLAALRDDPALRTRMGIAGRGHAVTSYTWDRNATLMLDTYAGLGLRGK